MLNEVAKAMNVIMRLGSADYGPLLDVVIIYFLYILEDNREHLVNSDSDDDSGPEINCGSGLQMNCESGPQTDATLSNISCCKTSFNCVTVVCIKKKKKSVQ